MTTASEDIETIIPSTAVDPAKSPTGRLLEQRSLEIINCINSRNFETLYKYAAPTFIDFRAVGGDFSHHGPADAVAFMHKVAMENPDYSVEPLSTLVEINEDGTYGTVWINILRTGLPTGTKMENVNRFRWRNTKEGWVCIRHSVLNAVPPMSGL